MKDSDYGRRDFFALCAGLGITSSIFAGLLRASAANSPENETSIRNAIDQAASLAGIVIAPDQKAALVQKLIEQRDGYLAIRALHLPNSVPPAYVFRPEADFLAEREPKRHGPDDFAAFHVADSSVPKDLRELAFADLMTLGAFLRRRVVSSRDLTAMYLERLKAADPILKCVVHLTEARARQQSEDADREIAQGKYRGPLHGIPWGAKDLLAVKGYPTTWGANGYENQSFDDDAEVVKRLDAAGAVLIAKLSLGALAMNDFWFGGRTRNPWNPELGSSGSSAGSASAVAAGCAGFTIGSETLGSISSPSTRCGATGLRPTFGRVPRTGAMALSWTMDKLGPICRTVEDAALVLQAIYGPDNQDHSVRSAPFSWDPQLDWRTLRVGFLSKAFAGEGNEFSALPSQTPSADDQRERQLAKDRRVYDQRFDLAALDHLKKMGIDLIPIEFPSFPLQSIASLLVVESAAAFDELTLSGRDKLLSQQGPDDWPNLFRAARFYTAVEYVQANRARTLLMRAVGEIFEKVDVLVCPTEDDQLIATNLTGHPAVILPNGIRGADAPPRAAKDTGDDDRIGGPGTPVSLTFLGKLYGETALLALANAYQKSTDFHQLEPPLFRVH